MMVSSYFKIHSLSLSRLSPVLSYVRLKIIAKSIAVNLARSLLNWSHLDLFLEWRKQYAENESILTITLKICG